LRRIKLRTPGITARTHGCPWSDRREPMIVEPPSAIVMYGSRPLNEPANLEPILNVLENASLSPTGWSLDERTNLSYTKQEVLSQASKAPYSIYIRRRAEIQYDLSINFGLRPFFEIDFGRKLKSQHWEDVFNLSPAITNAYHPDITLTYTGH